MDEIEHELIGAYAVDALEQNERLAFERHLETCRACQLELAGLRDALAGLSDDYAAEPPPALRAAVLDAVAGLPDLDDRGAATADDPVGVDAPSVEAGAEPPPRRALAPEVGSGASEDDSVASVTPLRARRAHAPGRTRWQVLVAAAMVVVAVIGIAVWQPWAQRAITADDVLAAPDAIRATETMANDASVTLVVSRELGRAVLVTHNLPDAPSGRVRQAWLEQPSGMVSAGLMPTGGDHTMVLEGDARTARGAGITVEPAGGSTEPTLADAMVTLEL
ncbi:MAG: anti-sigma factor [Micropruina sp.]